MDVDLILIYAKMFVVVVWMISYVWLLLENNV